MDFSLENKEIRLCLLKLKACSLFTCASTKTKGRAHVASAVPH
jgi:hypothetical protein